MFSFSALMIGVALVVAGCGGGGGGGTVVVPTGFAFLGQQGKVFKETSLTSSTATSFGETGSGANQFGLIRNVLLDSSQRFLVADSDNHRIVRFDDFVGSNWTVYNTASGTGAVFSPYGLATDSAGRLYTCDFALGKVLRLDSISGTNPVSYGTLGSGTGKFNGPTDIAIGTDGKIYVADSLNARIVRLDDMTGAGFTSYAAQTRALALDSSNRIYYSDNLLGKVIRVDNITGANKVTSTTTFSGITDIKIDKTGGIVVVDNGNRVSRMDDMAGTNLQQVTSAGGTALSNAQSIAFYEP